MPSIATLLAAGATLVSDKHAQGRKRKPLGDITPHLNARKTQKKPKAKIHRLTKDEKISSAAEREFISSLCKQLEDDAMVYHAAKSKPDGDTPRIRYGAVSKLVTSLKPTYHFLSIPKINNTLATRRLLREKAEHSKHQENTPYVDTCPPVEIDTPLNADTPPHALETKSKFGQKSGSTNKKKREEKIAYEMLLNEIANVCKDERRAIQLEGKTRLPKGRLSTIIEEAKQKFRMPDVHVSESTIKDRVLQGKPTCFGGCGLRSPMLKVEDRMVTILVQMGRIRQPTQFQPQEQPTMIITLLPCASQLGMGQKMILIIIKTILDQENAFPVDLHVNSEGRRYPAWYAGVKREASRLKFTDCLRTMDELKLFPRIDGLRPFLIVDGHGSRLELPFLNYINDPEHEWCVCLGVPYGTAYWQVGDSKQQNGSFKIYLTKAKMIIIRRKIELGMKVIRVEKYEIIPCVNAAFGQSFGNVEGTKTALCERGWCPLNRYLLDDPDIRGSMTPADKKMEEDLGGISQITANKNAIGAAQEIASLTLLRKAAADRDHISTTVLPALNLTTGMAGTCLAAIVQDNDLQVIRQRIDNNREEGKTVQVWLNEAKKITSGIIKKAGHAGRLDKNITAAVQKKADETQKRKDDAEAKVAEKIRLKEAKEEAKALEAMMKARVAWRKTRKAAMAVRQTGKTPENFTISELKKMVRYKRGPGNRDKTSNKRDELITMYQACAGLPSPPVSDDEDAGGNDVCSL
eukprot:scaffold59017_cov48-Attheya_sp.AAC.1